MVKFVFFLRVRDYRQQHGSVGLQSPSVMALAKVLHISNSNHLVHDEVLYARER